MNKPLAKIHKGSEVKGDGTSGFEWKWCHSGSLVVCFTSFLACKILISLTSIPSLLSFIFLQLFHLFYGQFMSFLLSGFFSRCHFSVLVRHHRNSHQSVHILLGSLNFFVSTIFNLFHVCLPVRFGGLLSKSMLLLLLSSLSFSLLRFSLLSLLLSLSFSFSLSPFPLNFHQHERKASAFARLDFPKANLSSLG